MKTLEIEGFKIETNLDEQQIFQSMLCDFPNDKEIIDSIEGQLIACDIMDFIEKVGIDEVPVNDYFYTNCRGYKNRYLEPFNWRATKKHITLIYTGAMGGGSWYAKIFINN